MCLKTFSDQMILTNKFLANHFLMQPFFYPKFVGTNIPKTIIFTKILLLPHFFYAFSVHQYFLTTHIAKLSFNLKLQLSWKLI